MSALASVPSLGIDDTVEVSRVSHRLVLGIQWLDALTGMPVPGDWVNDLEAVGSRAGLQRFERHPQARQALRHAGRLAKVLRLAAADKVAAPPADVADDQTNFVVRAFARRDPRHLHYRSDNDPRQYVPRRLSLTPVQSDGVPPSSVANIRTAWLWPGATYPLAANASAIRGCIRRGAALSSAVPVPWARVVLTRPGAAPVNFAGETQLAWAHGDDRGEFLVLLGAQAVPGGVVLPATIALRLWVFLPPAAPLDAGDPLASLALEVAAGDPLNDVLRGTAIPAGYLMQAGFIDLTLQPGVVSAVSDADLLFA
ncbi:hypothetical protein [Accumulibacter sp.]|uniref:hypothetical protein n=1 Tax=Accumulibacter sp. TaxID=2053492 RepID=UPI0028C43388|nr:hypothetical protein [Accumulibacter sp.]